jgi:hypothetical protein
MIECSAECPSQRAAVNRRHGFTMVEMLLVMFLLWAGLAVGMVALWGSMRVEKSAAAGLFRQSAHGLLADQFRNDVAQAVSAPESTMDVKSGPTCLILGTSEGKHIIIYQWGHSELLRSERTSAHVSSQRVGVGPGCVGVEFARRGPEGRLITMRLSEARGMSDSTRQVEFSAALGGDVR